MTVQYNLISTNHRSHPAMLDHADRPHVQFGSVAQFKPVPARNGTQPANLEVMGRKDIFYSGSLLNLPEYRQNIIDSNNFQE